MNEQDIQSYLPSLEAQITSKLTARIDSELKSQVSSLESEILSKIQSLIQELKTNNKSNNGKDDTEDESASRKITDETISSRVENFIKKTERSREAFNNYAAQSQSSSELSLPEIIALPSQKGAEPNNSSDKFGTTTTVSDTGGAIADHPFRITSVQNPDNANQYIVNVGGGTINGIIANNWNSSFYISSDSTFYVVLSVQTNGTAITGCSLGVQSEPPATPDAQKWSLSSTFSVLIGAVYNSDVKQVVFNNLSANGLKRITTEKENIQLQQLPYDNWYAWSVT